MTAHLSTPAIVVADGPVAVRSSSQRPGDKRAYRLVSLDVLREASLDAAERAGGPTLPTTELTILGSLERVRALVDALAAALALVEGAEPGEEFEAVRIPADEIPPEAEAEDVA